MRRHLLSSINSSVFQLRGPLQTVLDSVPSTSGSFAVSSLIRGASGSSEDKKGKEKPPKAPKSGDKEKDKKSTSAAFKMSDFDQVAPPSQIQFHRSITEEHLYNVIYPDLILKQDIRHVHELPTLREVNLHHATDMLTGSPQAFIPAMAAMQLACGRRPDVVQDVRKAGSGVEKRSVHIPMALIVKLRHRDQFRFLDRVCTQTLLSQLREWPGARWDWNGHVRLKFPNLFGFDEVANRIEDFKSVDTVDVELNVDNKGKGHVIGKLLATGLGIPVDRDYAGPLPMTVRPLMRRAPRAGEPGPRRRKLIEERKRALSESYRRKDDDKK